MRLLWDNNANNATLAAGSSANNYPVTNVLDWQAAKAWRSTGVDAERIYIDAGANNTITATCVAIVEHNWGANGTYRIQANSANNWVSPSLNQAITHANGVIVQTFNSTNQRYWSLYIDDDSNPDGYVKVGYLFLGTYYQFTDQPQKDFPIGFNDTSSSWSSKTGQDFTNVGIVKRQWSFQWPYFTNADRLAVDAIYDACGMARPIVVVPAENNMAEILPLFMKFKEPPAWNHLIGFKWNLALSFGEQL